MCSFLKIVQTYTENQTKWITETVPLFQHFNIILKFFFALKQFVPWFCFAKFYICLICGAAKPRRRPINQKTNARDKYIHWLHNRLDQAPSEGFPRGCRKAPLFIKTNDWGGGFYYPLRGSEMHCS